MKLEQLIRVLPNKKIIDGRHQLSHVFIDHLTSSSSEVSANTLFIAIRGFSTDGHTFLESVVKAGVRCVVVEKAQDLSSEVVQVVVSDTRVAMAQLACAFYQHPSQNMTCVGITGTNGKTTTTFLLESILREASFFPGVIGTIHYRYQGHCILAPNTTPDALTFQSLLSRMHQAGVTHLVCEVSSHGLKLHRVDGTQFDVVIFTNLTQDHLDFHPDFEDYYQSKKRLFVPMLFESSKKQKSAVINIDDAYGRRLRDEIKNDCNVLTYSVSDPSASIYGMEVSFSQNGIRAKLKVGAQVIPMASCLLGQHNFSNILAAWAASYALHIPSELILKGIAALRSVPGRLQRVDVGQDFLVVVDYAHTDDALLNVGRALTAMKENRIITVFGCGGDRDRKKRPLMAKATQSFSDYVIVTSDNPRTEDPTQIIEDIKVGFSNPSIPIVIEPDRKKAIVHAVMQAKSGDIILIAGKGHEDYQIVGKQKIHFDDAEVAEGACLKRLKS
ncbi:MAG: UDP-N-acetylmuramoyl-L-alanyl-D-glutamate--2,6-diaminopimelate ligase [Deltaproteobacteria bacterium]|nr:UDP-N-acetylmuramoyl-L-alanyl-D-glutamate--2,6-diaminopimelate ligase [Deltaproteobacteria bacterium]